MNLFKKAHIKKILDLKIKNGEIRSYQIANDILLVKKSKKIKYAIDMTSLSYDI